MKENEKTILDSIKSFLELGNLVLHIKEFNLLIKSIENTQLRNSVVENIKRKNIGKAIDLIDEFLYVNSKSVYQYNSLDIVKFYFDELDSITINEIKEKLGLEKLSLNTDKYNIDIYRHWEHYSRFEVRITKELATKVKEKNDTSLRIKKDIKVSEKGYYTSFSIVGNDENFDDEISENRYENYYYEEDYSSRYSRYNGIYGLDDNTIDDAFDGDPDNYWNID